MTKRKQIDWEAIEKEYRMGAKSMRTIAVQFNTTAGTKKPRGRRNAKNRRAG